MRWETICFDLDNTLFSHEAAFEKAICHCYCKQKEQWQKQYETVHYPSEREWFKRFKYYSDYYWKQFEQNDIDATTYRRLRYYDTVTEFSLPYSEAEADRFHQLYYQIVYRFSERYEGVEPLLRRLREKQIQVAIITNGTIDTQYKKVQQLQLEHYIPRERIFISEQLGIAKPDKRIFSYVLKKLNGQAETSLFVGDSWEHDIVGAIHAGWEAIYLNSRQKEPADRSVKPLAVCRTFTEVSDIIHRLNRLEG